MRTNSTSEKRVQTLVKNILLLLLPSPGAGTEVRGGVWGAQGPRVGPRRGEQQAQERETFSVGGIPASCTLRARPEGAEVWLRPEPLKYYFL